MTQFEIIEIAAKAGLHYYDFVWTSPTQENLYPEGIHQEALEKFVKLAIKEDRKRLSEKLKQMPLNDTANSIAIWIGEQE